MNSGPTDVLVLPPSSDPATPEQSGDGLDITTSVRDALTDIDTRPTRHPVTGKYLKGAVAKPGTLERSEQFWNAVAPAKRELATATEAALAIDDSTPPTLRGLIEAYAEVRLFRTAMFHRLTEMGGPITTKGKSRALYTAYMSAVDREMKLAQLLGLERKAKPVNPLDAVRAAVAEANRK